MVNIGKLQRMTMRYELADGVRELHQAIWLLLMGVYVWLLWDAPGLWMPIVQAARTQGNAALLVVILAMFGIPIMVMQVSLMLMNVYVRRRWLWRNTGVIKPKAWIIPRRVLFTAYAVMLTLFLVVTWVAVQREDLWLIVRAAYLGTGCGLCWMSFWVGRLFELPRYQISAGVGGLGTLIILVLPVSLGMGGLLMGLLWAGTMTASGVYAIWQFNQEQDTFDAA